MSLTTAVAAVAALAAGTAGAVTAYQMAAPEPAAQTTAAVETDQRRPGADRPRFAPCKPPAKLEAGKCVTTVTRTVNVDGGSTTVPAVGGAPGVPAPAGESSPFVDDDARRDLDDDDLEVVEDHDDHDDFDSHTGTSTNTGTNAGTNTGTQGGTNTGTSTRTGHH